MFIIGYATGGLRGLQRVCRNVANSLASCSGDTFSFWLSLSHFLSYLYHISFVTDIILLLLALVGKSVNLKTGCSLFFPGISLKRQITFDNHASSILLHMLKYTHVKSEYICIRGKTCFGGLIEQSGYLVEGSV